MGQTHTLSLHTARDRYTMWHACVAVSMTMPLPLPVEHAPAVRLLTDSSPVLSAAGFNPQRCQLHSAQQLELEQPSPLPSTWLGADLPVVWLLWHRCEEPNEIRYVRARVSVASRPRVKRRLNTARSVASGPQGTEGEQGFTSVMNINDWTGTELSSNSTLMILLYC